MKKLLNKVLTDSANSAQDSLEKHNLLFSKKKKKIYIYIYIYIYEMLDVEHKLSIQTGTKKTIFD